MSKAALIKRFRFGNRLVKYYGRLCPHQPIAEIFDELEDEWVICVSRDVDPTPLDAFVEHYLRGESWGMEQILQKTRKGNEPSQNPKPFSLVIKEVNEIPGLGDL